MKIKYDVTSIRKDTYQISMASKNHSFSKFSRDTPSMLIECLNFVLRELGHDSKVASKNNTSIIMADVVLIDSSEIPKINSPDHFIDVLDEKIAYVLSMLKNTNGTLIFS